MGIITVNTAKLFFIASLILASSIATAEETIPTSTPFNFGIGVGVNYGGLGLNAEYAIQQWGAYGAFGIAGNTSGVVGLLAGARYHLSTGNDFQPRLSASIGSFPAKFCTDYHCKYERAGIYGIGLGFRINHIDLDISYFRSDDFETYVDDIDGTLRNKSFVDLSVGYRF